MSRSSSFGHQYHSAGHSPAFDPPSEQRNPAQVPYYSSDRSNVSGLGIDPLPQQWATRREKDSRSVLCDRCHNISSHQNREFDDGVHLHTHNGLKRETLPPYPTYGHGGKAVYIPPGPKSAPTPPTYARPSPVPRPREFPSPRIGWDVSTSSPAPAAPRALPGTMSSRTVTVPLAPPPPPTTDYSVKEPQRRPPTHDQPRAVHRKSPSATFGKRCKGVFKDMFKRDHTNDAMLEKISDRHWTDDASDDGLW